MTNNKFNSLLLIAYETFLTNEESFFEAIRSLYFIKHEHLDTFQRLQLNSLMSDIRHSKIKPIEQYFDEPLGIKKGLGMES